MKGISHWFLSGTGRYPDRETVKAGASKENGQQCHLRGWQVGVMLQASTHLLSGCDEIAIYMTGGSIKPVPKLLGIVKLDEESNTPSFVPVSDF